MLKQRIAIALQRGSADVMIQDSMAARAARHELLEEWVPPRPRYPRRRYSPAHTSPIDSPTPPPTPSLTPSASPPQDVVPAAHQASDDADAVNVEMKEGGGDAVVHASSSGLVVSSHVAPTGTMVADEQAMDVDRSGSDAVLSAESTQAMDDDERVVSPPLDVVTPMSDRATASVMTAAEVAACPPSDARWREVRLSIDAIDDPVSVGALDDDGEPLSSFSSLRRLSR
jgi:hypothetical protein